MKANVLVVDDHEAARMGISELLQSRGFQVATHAENGTQAVSIMDAEPIDAVIMDVRMPAVDGLSALEMLQAKANSLPVIVFSAYDNPTYIARAAALGAYDYIVKNGQSQKVCDSLRSAIDGESPPSGSRLIKIRKQLNESIEPDRLPSDFPLTRRESQVLVHVGLGLSNKEISKSLHISVETVKEHVQNILRKTNASDRTDAAVRAVRLGFI